MNFTLTKLTSTLIIIALIAFGYFIYTALGGTTFNLTLTPPAGSSAGGPTLATGLVGHWTFDGKDMVSNVADISGQGNTGYLSGQTSTTTAMGVIGQALQFDGTDDYVQMVDGDTLKLDGSFTISAWLKMHTGAATNNSGVLGRKNNNGTTKGYALYVDGGYGNGEYYFAYADGTTRTILNINTNYSDDLWYHVVVVREEGNKLFMYIDGLEKGSTADASPGDIVSTTNVLDLGKATNWYWEDNGGEIDDVRIYNRALSQEEITRLYNMGAPKIKAADKTGLVGHWTFDGPDMESNVADVSGQGNHGALQGQTSTTTAIGKIGQALKFDGSDDRVVRSEAIIEGKPITFSAWINPNNTNVNKTIVSIGEGAVGNRDVMYLEAGSTGIIRVLQFIDGAFSSANGSSYSADAWQHIVGVVDSLGNVDIYVNMVLTTGLSITATNPSGMDTTAIGAFVDNSSVFLNHFDGLIDDVRIYNRALSADEVKRLYNSGAPVTISKPEINDGLVGYWNFDVEAGGEIVYDQSTSTNDGTMVNMDPSTDWVDGKIGSGAMDFDGVGDKVSMGNHDIFRPTSMTLSVWVKVASVTGTNKFIIGQFDGAGNNGYELVVNSATLWWAHEKNWAVNLTTFDFTVGVWAYIALVYDENSGTTVYGNGIVVDTDGNTGALATGSHTFTIGEREDGWGPHAETIDDVRIYNRALSADEITRLYKMGR